MSGLASVKFQCCKTDAVYARYEYFNDPEGFMGGILVDANSMITGLNIMGVTLGVEKNITSNSYIRLEGRQLIADNAQQIFYWKNENSNTRMEAMIHLGVSF